MSCRCDQGTRSVRVKLQPESAIGTPATGARGEHFLLFLRRDGLVGGDESRGEEWILGEVTIDGNTSRILRQLCSPIGSGAEGSAAPFN